MEEIRSGAMPAFQKRLQERLTELLRTSNVEPQRLAQEAALLADRSDISEELIRLKTHAGELAQLVGAGGEIGKKLDFLLQEMNRETNTILSKTGGLGDLGLTITELALAAKSEIDKIREQSLNLELRADHCFHHLRAIWVWEIDARRAPACGGTEAQVFGFLHYPSAPRS